MIRRSQFTSSEIALPVLIALSLSHCLNDLLQSLLAASYPLFKEDLALSFGQIGLITLVYQMAASVFQPLAGLFFDKRPFVWSLPAGMCFTLVGLLNLAFASNLHWVLVSVFLIGVGSSILHPEASRITSLAYFAIVAFVAILVMIPVCRWYKAYLRRVKWRPANAVRHAPMPLPHGRTFFAIAILLTLIFSKYIYMASLSSYYTFYLMHKFGVSVQQSQIFLFVFLLATAAGTLMGGPIGDRIGRKYVIWMSILGTAPFSILMPHVSLAWTVVLSFCVGFMLSSAFPAILLYAQELLPNKLGLISGLFFGFAFGIAGIASAVLGDMADHYGIEAVYNICAYMPLLGLVTWFLPDLKKVPR